MRAVIGVVVNVETVESDRTIGIAGVYKQAVGAIVPELHAVQQPGSVERTQINTVGPVVQE